MARRIMKLEETHKFMLALLMQVDKIICLRKEDFALNV